MAAISPKGLAAVTAEGRKRGSEKMTGVSNPAWKGGVAEANARAKLRRRPIMRCPDDLASMAWTNGWTLEHRVIVARALGRPLVTSETVHHIDDDETNNDPANLMLFKSNADHLRFEAGQDIAPLWDGSTA